MRDLPDLYWNADYGRWQADDYASNPPRSDRRMAFEREVVRMLNEERISSSRAAEILRLPIAELRQVVQEHSR